MSVLEGSLFQEEGGTESGEVTTVYSVPSGTGVGRGGSACPQGASRGCSRAGDVIWGLNGRRF